jgi:hypothetical protein
VKLIQGRLIDREKVGVRNLKVQEAAALTLMWDGQTPQLLLYNLTVDHDSSMVI